MLEFGNILITLLIGVVIYSLLAFVLRVKVRYLKNLMALTGYRRLFCINELIKKPRYPMRQVLVV